MSSRALGASLAAAAVFTGTAVGCDSTFRFDDHSIDAGSEPDADAAFADVVEAGADGAQTTCASDLACGPARCDLATHACVACLGDGDCRDPNRRFCAAPLQYCVECRTDDQCGSRRRCDTAASRCVDTCSEGDERCPSAFSCDESGKLCVECKSNANCAGNPNGAVCDTAIGRCVECASNAQCAVAKPACDRRVGKCVECITSLACGAGRICDPTASTCRAP